MTLHPRCPWWKATPLLLAILADPSQPEVARDERREVDAELRATPNSICLTVQSGDEQPTDEADGRWS